MRLSYFCLSSENTLTLSRKVLLDAYAGLAWIRLVHDQPVLPCGDGLRRGGGSVVERLPLAAKAQLLNDGLVTVEVFALQVIEQLSPFRRHHEQAPSGMEILSVGL